MDNILDELDEEDLAEEEKDEDVVLPLSAELIKSYEDFNHANQSNFENIYSNAIEYKLTPKLLSVLSISNASKCTLWLQKESQQDRVELTEHLRGMGKSDFPSATFSYSEVDYYQFGEILFMLVKKHGLKTESTKNRFVDLGSGGGKAVFTAFFSGLFFSCVGIELLPRLYKASKQYLRYYKRRILSSIEADEITAENKIDFIHGDFTYLDWSSGYVSSSSNRSSNQEGSKGGDEQSTAIIFALSTCFDDKSLRRTALIANKLSTGSFLICTTFSFLSTAYFDLLDTVTVPLNNEVFSDRATPQNVFIYRRNGYRGESGEQVIDPLSHLETVLARKWS
mmetsp:Transcript_21999/g.31607  ORF Transcript_21999/g.31607 Transcript_21999/m.31607 type:complete len:338 (-) Transcript_21999:178-1191(-)